MQINGIDQTAPAVRQNTPDDETDLPPVLKRLVYDEMHKHSNNWMGGFVGETGLGKSYAAIRVGEKVDPDFGVEKVCFGTIPFMERITESHPTGDFTVFEEASVEADSSEYMSKANKALRYVSETWRHQNRAAAFTLPAFGRLDSGVRGRLVTLFQLDYKNEQQGYTLARVRQLQEDSFSGQIYRHAPVLDGVKHNYVKFRPPSDHLLEKYERRKEEYTQELNEELLEDLLAEYAEDKPGDPDDGTPDDPDEIANDILDGPGVGAYITDNHGQRYIDRSGIKSDYDIGESKSKQVKRRLREWGSVDDDVQ
jgi:hypothetical protein